MKKFICFLLLMSVLVFDARSQTEVESQVKSASSTLTNAIVNADQNALQEITADELSYGHSSGKIENKSEFISAVLNGNFDFLAIDVTGQTVKIVGDIAIERHTMNAKITNEGKPGELKLSILLIWQNQKGKWKLIARQAVRI